MPDLLEVILINLIVSFDNIGVIALATRGLDTKKANIARLTGIWLSLALKFVFLLIVSHLFDITWLHIRIIGGAMLIYVIIGMIRDTGNHKHMRQNTSLFKVVMVIALADISMSLDNVIAVAAIVADEAGSISPHGMSVAFLGLALSVPVLLLASERIIYLINRHAVLFALCAGYLGYIAAQMIFADDLFESLFAAMRFAGAPQLAVMLGILVAVISWRKARVTSNVSHHQTAPNIPHPNRD